MPDRTYWRAHGKCSTLSAEEADKLFYLSKGQSPKAAKQFCEDCPVRRPCLFFALYYKEVGIWAGTTDKERLEFYDFVIDEVEIAMSFTYIESRNLADFLPPQHVSSLQSTESSGWDDQRLVS